MKFNEERATCTEKHVSAEKIFMNRPRPDKFDEMETSVTLR